MLDASLSGLAIPTTLVAGDTGSPNSTPADCGESLSIDWSTCDAGAAQVASGAAGEACPAEALPGDGFIVGTHVSDRPAACGLETFSTFASVETSLLLLVESEPPVIFNLAATNTTEGGMTTLTGEFFDPDLGESFTIEIDWGDGQVEAFNYPAGTTSFTQTHQYLDDDPSGTSSDPVFIHAIVRDEAGNEDSDTVQITVANAAPVILNLAGTNTQENGQTTLTGEFFDPGTLDSFTLEVDWGDGQTETFHYGPGAASFSETHQYLNDPPGGTYVISVKLIDDDGGDDTDSVVINVENVAPAIQNLAATNVNENGFTTLTGEWFDPGTLDTFTLEVNWGDGHVETFTYAAGVTSFSETHQYLDDNPTGTSSDPYTISVRLIDDDGGEDTDSVIITVANVAPLLQNLAATNVNENGFTTLTGEWFDPGTLDTFTLEVDWGDGHVETFTYAAGVTSFSETHQYLDDNPTGTSSDPYTISVRLIDDDGGEDTDSVIITVANVAPLLQNLAATNVDESGSTTLSGMIVDPGTLDTFTLEVDWGDGHVETFTYAAGVTSFSETHQYLDDNPTGTSSDPYTISVRLIDDDGGEDTDSVIITVANVAPLLTLVDTQNRLEGQLLDLSGLGGAPSLGTFTDVGTLDTHTATIDWGDGAMEAATVSQSTGGGSLGGSHVYADNGVYTVTVTLTDDDGGVVVETFTVVVSNVAPSLTVVGQQSVDEGSLLQLPNIGSLTDPGFDNPNRPGGPTVESFSYYIDWGDGTSVATGAAVIDVFGAPGVATAASFDGSHIYADNGTYTVIVRVADDDMSGNFTSGIAGVDFVEQTFTVIVHNVAPILTGLDAPKIVNEGQAFVLSNLGGGGVNLGIGLSDPGFDNPANAGNLMNGGEVEETFTGMTIDWGDGTAPTAVQIVNRVSGGPGVLTTAQFEHLAHVYADDGVYTVTVTFSDDDGGEVARTFTIQVNNVAPTLVLTTDVFVINEGQTLTIPNLGTFTDPGFNNPNNPHEQPGGSRETFTYSINWGDGTPTQTMQLPVSVVDGAPGVLTFGSLANSNLYADNDADNKYTITVTISDDDGGSHTQSIEITVLNVNPTLLPVSATDVTSTGQTTLMLTFSDPGADSFQILVDWGDKLSLPPAERFVVETAYAGPTPASFTLMHVYAGPPDPLHPTADITITVMILDDDAQIVGVVQPGVSNPESVTISNPGINTVMVAIDTTPDVPRLDVAPPPAAPAFIQNQAAAAQTVQTTILARAGAESTFTTERYLRLCALRPDGRPARCFRIADEALQNLRAFVASLPDGRYQIFVVRPETNTQRLVIEVDVRRGQLIDTSDETEGIRDRPPTSETLPGVVPPGGGGQNAPLPLEQNPLLNRLPDPSPSAALALPPGGDADTRLNQPPTRESADCTACAGLVAAGAAAWSNRVEAALAHARDDDWRRLRQAGRLGKMVRSFLR